MTDMTREQFDQLPVEDKRESIAQNLYGVSYFMQRDAIDAKTPEDKAVFLKKAELCVQAAQAFVPTKTTGR